MNWMLLDIVVPLALLLLLSILHLIQQISLRNKASRQEAFGGLQGWIYYLWCCTYVISSVGVLVTFAIHAILGEGWPIIAIFMCMDVSLIGFNAGFLRKSTPTVFFTLVLAVSSYLGLFVYTLYVFPDMVGIVGVHVCNAICVFHGLVLDFGVWQYQWYYSVTQEPVGPEDLRNSLIHTTIEYSL